MALAGRLNISLDFLASAEGEDPKGAAVARNEFEAVLLYASRAMTPDAAEALLVLALGSARATKPTN